MPAEIAVVTASSRDFGTVGVFLRIVLNCLRGSILRNIGEKAMLSRGWFGLFSIACGFALTLVSSVASAQDWAEKMFTEKSHEFGSVPKAAKVEYAFVITNPYKEDVHISSVRSSCGCTIPRIQKDTLKSWEKGAVIAEFNTRAFSGQRGARVTVTIDKPYFAEVQLQVHGYIRTDVVVDPGQVAFGQIPTGQVPKSQ